MNETIIQFNLNPSEDIVISLALEGLLRSYFRPIEIIFNERYPRLAHFSYVLGLRSSQISRRIKRIDKRSRFNTSGSKDTGNHDLQLADAYRHVLWSALLSKYLGANVAMCILSLHETDPDMMETLSIDTKNEQMFNDRLMDFHNNFIGVAIGRQYLHYSDKELEQFINKLLFDKDGPLVVISLETSKLIPATNLIEQFKSK